MPTKPSSSVFYNSTDNGSFNVSNKNYISYCFHSVTGYSKFGSYSGTGNANNAVTLGFRPAFLMVKRINSTEDWFMFDSTRNPLNTVTQRFKANTTDADGAYSYVNFTDTGFSLQATGTGQNGSGDSYIYMAFAGGMDSISDYNDTGSIDSRVKANTTYGQSVVSYTGNGSDGVTVGHGLSSAPDMVIVKDRDGTPSWSVGHVGLGTNEVLLLNQTGAKANCTTDYSGGGVGARGSSHFTLEAGTSNANNVNTNGNKYIAYCFHSVTGYSKFGSYSGSGNASGNSVALGFEPAFVMVKASSGSYSWAMFDKY